MNDKPTTKTPVKAEPTPVAWATGTVRLHRVLQALPERVYKAFLDPDALAKWLPPHGFTGKVHRMNATVGGGYKMSFTNFGTGQTHSASAVPSWSFCPISASATRISSTIRSYWARSMSRLSSGRSWEGRSSTSCRRACRRRSLSSSPT